VATIGVPGSATYAQTLSGIEEMLSVIPDNTGNEVSAQDVRDVVYTLYEDIQGLSFSEFTYTNLTPSTNAVGNFPVGTTFSGLTLQDLFDGIFNKDIMPTSNLVISGGTSLDFKSSQAQETNKVLTWTAVKGTYQMNTLGRLQGASIPSGEVSLTVPVGGGSNTYVTTPIINQTNTYKFITKDILNNTSESTVTVNYRNRYFWGKVSATASFTLSSQVTDLSSTNVSVSGSGGFATSFVGSFDGIDGGGEYLCWAFPTSFGTPKFLVNGMTNTAFTKINSAFNFINTFGYSVQYDVWISNSIQNSPIDKFQIT
jgi:hypothetical protein